MVNGIHHFWYIPYILFCYLITPLLYDFREYIREKKFIKFRTITIYSILGIIVFQILFKAFHIYFNLAWVLCYITGFFLYDFVSSLSKKTLFFTTFFIFIISIILNYYKYAIRYLVLPRASNLTKTFCLYYIDYSRIFLAISIFLVFWFIGKNFIKKVPDLVLKILNFTDKYTYNIYIVHMIYIKGIFTLVNKTEYIALNFLIVITVSTISGILLNKASKFLKLVLNKTILS